MDPTDEAPGRRLERYISARWGRSKGGMKGLCAEMGVSTESLYAWFRGDAEPQLGSITKIAEALGVSRVEVLAAMDGDSPEPSEAMARRIAREETQAAIEELIAAGRLQVLPEPPRGSKRAGGSR